MSGAKGLSTLGLILLDSHVRITIADQSNFVSLLGKNGKLLFLSRCALGLVIPGKPLPPIVNHLFFRLTVLRILRRPFIVRSSSLRGSYLA